MDLYSTLGVDRKASTAEIKSAYRHAAKKHHPDTGGDARTFALLTQAYSTLKDEDARAHYDATGEAGVPRINSVQSRAHSLIAMVIDKFLERDDLLHLDLPKAVLRELNQVLTNTNQGEAQAKAIRKKIERLHTAQQRLKSTEKDALLISMLIKKTADLEQAVQKLEREVQQARDEANLAIKIVTDANYQWTADPQTTASGDGAGGYRTIKIGGVEFMVGQ